MEQYGTIAFWGIATLTQLLSDVGVMTDINMMVWMYGEIFACLAIVAATGLRLFAYWTAHGVVTTVGSPNASTAETLKGALEYEMLHTMALNGFAGSILNGQKDNWLQAQWNGLSSERQAELQAAYDAANKTSESATVTPASLLMNHLFSF